MVLVKIMSSSDVCVCLWYLHITKIYLMELFLLIIYCLFEVYLRKEHKNKVGHIDWIWIRFSVYQIINTYNALVTAENLHFRVHISLILHQSLKKNYATQNKWAFIVTFYIFHKCFLLFSCLLTLYLHTLPQNLLLDCSPINCSIVSFKFWVWKCFAKI